MRRSLTLAAVSAFGVAGVAFSLAAYAAGAASTWDHNGSKVTLEENGTKRRIVYVQPKAGMDKAGVTRGSVLFDGETKKDGRVAGYAKIFRAGCDPVDYFVEGSIDPKKGEMVLQGQAPVYSGKDCKITGYSDDNAASTLTFTALDAPRDRNYAGRGAGDGVEQGDGGDSARDAGPVARDDSGGGASSAPDDRAYDDSGRDRTYDDSRARDDRSRDYADGGNRPYRRGYDGRDSYSREYSREEVYPDDGPDDEYYEPVPPVDSPYYRPYRPRWRY